MTWPGPPLSPADAPTASLDATEWMRRQLFDRRIVMVTGSLDDRCATEVGAALMSLDAAGDGPVELQIDSAEGTVDAGLAVMDVIDLLGVPVHAWCTGRAEGPAVGVLTVSHRRTASPHARIRLTEPQVAFAGDARSLEQLAAEHLRRWSAFCARMAEVTGPPVDVVRADAAHGRFFSAAEAVAYGLVDDVAAPDARIARLPGRPLGFNPR